MMSSSFKNLGRMNRSARVLQKLGALGLGLFMASTGCCFVRGTRIATPRGFRRIDEIKVGDEVWSLGIDTQAPAVRKVAHVLRARGAEILQIAAGELVIAGVTPEHPFYDAGAGAWVEAGELREGTRLLAWLGSADVQEREITAVARTVSCGNVEVFNLTIHGPEHNYFAEGLLVHNKQFEGGDIDMDMDGFGSIGDCDDTDPQVNLLATEDCSDTIDNDCDEAIDKDDA